MVGLGRGVARPLSFILPPVIILALQLLWCLWEYFVTTSLIKKPAISDCWTVSGCTISGGSNCNVYSWCDFEGVWLWPPVMRWTRWGLTRDKLQTVLMKATELIHLPDINLEMMKYFASHITLGKHELALWKTAFTGICSVAPDKQLLPRMESSVKSFFLLLRQGNLTPLMAAEILEPMMLGLRLRLKPSCLQACERIPLRDKEYRVVIYS